MESSGYDIGEVPRVKCGSSHSLHDGVSDDVYDVRGEVDNSVCDDVEVCAVGGVSLDSRVCLVDSSFDGSGVDGCDVESEVVGDVSGGNVGEVRTAVVGGAVGGFSIMIGPLAEKDQAEVSDLQMMTAGLDESDARRLLQERQFVRRRKSRSLSTPKRPTSSRQSLIAKYKSLRGWSTPPRVERDFTKREKLIISRVKSFNEKEAAKARAVLKKSDEYCEEMISNISLVPFTNSTQRTVEMTGINERNIRRFAKQAKDMALTPIKKPGRKLINPPDWVFTDVRTIVTGLIVLLIAFTFVNLK